MEALKHTLAASQCANIFTSIQELIKVILRQHILTSEKKIKPLFPFGYGLSYTNFEYRKIDSDKNKIDDSETLKVFVTVANTGERQGCETVQLYVHAKDSAVMRPEKELRGFEKVFLEPGKEKTICFSLSKRAFAYYDTSLHGWNADGRFEIFAGSCCNDTPLCTNVTVHSTVKKKTVYTRQSHIKSVLQNPAGKKIITELMTQNGTKDSQVPDWILEMPLRALQMTGDISSQMIDRIVEKLNETDG